MEMSLYSDIFMNESQLFRAYSAPSSKVFVIRAIALLTHTFCPSNICELAHASMAHSQLLSGTF